MLDARMSSMDPSTKKIKELEIEDDGGFFRGDVCSSSPSPPSPSHVDAEEEEPSYRVVWDSSKNTLPNNSSNSPLSTNSSAVSLKKQGNAAYAKGDLQNALKLYKEAIKTLQEENQDPKSLSIVYSNVAATFLRLNSPSDAAAAARQAHSYNRTWTKPLHRLAEAHLLCREYAAAVSACTQGEKLCNSNAEGHTEFTPLIDKIAVEAALQGSTAGFTGRQLEVRSAGEEAWLGRPAPHVPALDGPLTEETALPSDDLTAASKAGDENSIKLLTNSVNINPTTMNAHKNVSARADALSTWRYSDTLAATTKLRTSFRCLKEALAAAKDGDKILLLKGVHNGMGQSVDVKKRVLIEGEGSIGETVIDQRANSPTFRISRGGLVIRNLEIDHTGFREAVLIEGKAAVAPLIDNCVIKCSGDDAVNVGQEASPMLRRCVITGKKCGVKSFESSKVRIEGCIVEKCGEQAVKAMEHSVLDATMCMLRDCEEEGAVVMDSATVSLLACTLTGNKAPGVDCSAAGKARIQGGEFSGNIGGIWLWEDSSAHLDGVRVNGGKSFVVLADGNSVIDACSCVFKGAVHAPDSAWSGLLDDERNNRFEDPENAVDFPDEQGAFRFVPNKYSRKQ